MTVYTFLWYSDCLVKFQLGFKFSISEWTFEFLIELLNWPEIPLLPRPLLDSNVFHGVFYMEVKMDFHSLNFIFSNFF